MSWRNTPYYRKWRKCLVLSFLFLSCICWTRSSVEASPVTPVAPDAKGDFCEVWRDAFISYQLQPIREAIVKKYGDDRQFMVRHSIIKRNEGQYTWRARIYVTTFVGAHNPPYHDYLIYMVRGMDGSPYIVNVHRLG